MDRLVQPLDLDLRIGHLILLAFGFELLPNTWHCVFPGT
jgi:hypothetical protein